MLVLSRSMYETVLIGKAGDVLEGPIEISIVDIRGGTIRIGFEAPKTINIVRPDATDTNPKNDR